MMQIQFCGGQGDTMRRAAALVLAALSSRKFFPAKRIGAQRSKIYNKW